jgi:hypothetical protein
MLIGTFAFHDIIVYRDNDPMIANLKRWAGHLVSIALYPQVVLEMIACSRHRSYVNRFSIFKAYVRLYNLSRGKTELVERYIFGPRLWRQATSLNSISSISPTLASWGWSAVDMTLDLARLRMELESVCFVPRISRDYNPTLYSSLSGVCPQGRWDAHLPDLFSLASFAEIVTHSDIHKLASDLLGEYIITSAVVWASYSCRSDNDRLASAQIFHVDYDYLDDIKLFFNLTNTQREDGPLEYITGSHGGCMKKIWTSGPIQEVKVDSCYPPECHAYFTGPAGAAYISDNRGIHRDHPPVDTRSKLALQINFSRSQFGSEQAYLKSRPKFKQEWPSHEIWQAAFEKNERAYSLLFSRL